MTRIITLSLAAITVLLLYSCKTESQNSSEVVCANTTSSNKYAPTQKGEAKKEAQKDHLNTGGLQWETFDQLSSKGKNNGKKYLVDVYTDWCGWCKVMDRTTFTEPKLQEYLRDNYNLIKFDAEQKDAITFKGTIYEWQNGGRNGINKLAIKLLGNRQSYPSMVYLDEEMNLIKAIPGYKKADQLLAEVQNINEAI